MTGLDPRPSGEPGSLSRVLAGCVVRVDEGSAFRGSGFFVAPGEVLTCAHVVLGCDDLTVTWDGGSARVEAADLLPRVADDGGRTGFYPFPDLALLRLDEPAGKHPCVRLDCDDPVLGPPPDVVGTVAWTPDEYVPGTAVRTAATFEFEGELRTDEGRLLKLKRGQVAHGFSGAPLLNARTAGICALVDSTRDARSDLGGFGVPIAAFVDDLPGLAARNAAFHERDRRWAHAVERDAVAQATRSARDGRLPLTAPVVELGWDGDGSRVELLHPRFGVVPFVGREALLANLMLWRERSDSLSVVVLTGPGGFGKTRTAIEACVDAGRAGWTSGFVAGSDGRPFTDLDLLTGWPGRLFVAVDYAETRPPGAVTELLGSLFDRPAGAPSRVVLVMRQGGSRDELREMAAVGDRRLELERVINSAELVRLDRDVVEIDRAELFRVAAKAFGQRLDRPTRPPLPDLSADHFARPLFVLAAALLCTAEVGIDVAGLAADDVLGAVLDRHEAEYWDRWNRRLGVGLNREQQRHAVALVALFGAETEQDALDLVGMVPGRRAAGAAPRRRRMAVEPLRRRHARRSTAGAPARAGPARGGARGSGAGRR